MIIEAQTNWHRLREFESKDIIKRYYKKRHNLQLGATKAYEITSAFIQGREYFNSYNTADLSVKPLLLYYGIVALSRGLILVLNPAARENNIFPAHGLAIKNPEAITSTKRYEDIILQSSKGTFSQLINATNNITYLRNGSSEINSRVNNKLPELSTEFTLKDIAYSLPDISESVEVWLDEKYPLRQLEKLRSTGDNYDIKIINRNNQVFEEASEKLFPKEICSNVNTSHSAGVYVNVSYSSSVQPRIVQKWANSFNVIGSPYLAPPMSSRLSINDISIMYAAAYVFGMISRYYPSAWNNINKGIQCDSIFPFAMRLLSFLENTYPRIIMDFLRAPYDFE